MKPGKTPLAFLVLPASILGKEMKQNNAPWGLHAISHRRPHRVLMSYKFPVHDYIFDDQAGAGTFAYIVDSGVRVSHKEFEGRAHHLWKPSGTSEADDLGHGTHVAGIVAAKTYGVAKKATVLSVKITDQYHTIKISNLLAGLNHAINDIVSKGRIGRAVVNMSLGSKRTGGCLSQAVQQMLRQAMERHITVLQAAGNQHVQAEQSCLTSDGSAITVGSMSPDWRLDDESAYGRLLDVLAPGTHIQSLSHKDDDDTTVSSGTSMAVAHASGVALTYMTSAQMDSSEVLIKLITASTPGKILGNLKGAPNLLVNNNNTQVVNRYLPWEPGSWYENVFDVASRPASV